MPRILPALLLALAFTVTGCDSAAPSETASVYGECSRAFTIFGPSTLAPGQTATYVANTDPNCYLFVVDWSVTSGNATILGYSGQYGANEVVTVWAPSSGGFTLRAVVETSAGVSGRSKTVAVN